MAACRKKSTDDPREESISDCNWTGTHDHLVRACFEQGIAWHSGNYRVRIHSEMPTWHDKNIQLEESITEDPEEEPITEDSKKILSLRTFKRTLSLWNLKRTLWGPSGASGPSMNYFFLFGMVCDRVGDGDKYSYETFGLGRPCFQATSHLKIEAKQFFMNNM